MKTYFLIRPFIDITVRNLCKMPYWQHPKGCPNYGKRSTCPPQAPFFRQAFNIYEPIYAVVNEFDLANHVSKMKAKHTDWTDPQLRCVLYWQGTARKQLREKVEQILTMELKGYIATYCPEAMGVNVDVTLKDIDIILEWPPEYIARQVAFLGRPYSGQFMVTVSELKWYQTIPIGKCPCCGKDKPLGILNIPQFGEEDEQRGPRCIDCFFGPPEPEFTPFDDEEDERYERCLYHSCEICGGEFWDGGTSCTCYEADDKEWDENEIVNDIIKE